MSWSGFFHKMKKTELETKLEEHFNGIECDKEELRDRLELEYEEDEDNAHSFREERDRHYDRHDYY